MGNRGKLSGPLLDRIDLSMEIPAPTIGELQDAPTGEASAAVRERVMAAHARQHARQGKANAHLAAGEIDTHCPLDDRAAALLRQAMERMGLSARAYHRTLRVARSIADLAQEEVIRSSHVAEAVQYRRGLPTGK